MTWYISKRAAVHLPQNRPPTAEITNHESCMAINRFRILKHFGDHSRLSSTTTSCQSEYGWPLEYCLKLCFDKTHQRQIYVSGKLWCTCFGALESLWMLNRLHHHWTKSFYAATAATRHLHCGALYCRYWRWLKTLVQWVAEASCLRHF